MTRTLLDLTMKATQLACHAAETNEGYQLFIKAIEEVSEQIYSLNIKTRTLLDTSPEELNICNEESFQFVLSDPNVSMMEGRKKDEKCQQKDHTGSRRFKSSIELVQKNKRRKCALCKGLGHDKRICPEKPKKNGNDLLIVQTIIT
ncbi:uncharacterized protein LOC111376666 isoform X2 [Olea europaea var. sylvestris]|uniref:uncharacterized protein LOC111376666 isoform X2 n=1 Tax=Olea europaea var. sylvestris TaxID=158386 RepID=UPI000C1D3C30|nr:uncharacterized protein LOC111376666 isoform X2 [Olea europaea var. sylvestris]